MMTQIWYYFRRILFMVRKELLTTLKDPKSRFVLTVPVIIEALLFGYVASFNLDRVDYALLDQSHSKYSTELAAKLDGSGIFRRVATLGNAGQIARFVDAGEVSAVVVIGPEFAKDITAGREAPVEVITDGRNTLISGLSSSYVTSVVAAYNKELHPDMTSLSVDTITWYNPNQITRWSFMASLLPMISLIQVMILAGLSVAREREEGTFDQLMVTPLTTTEILIGKAVPPLLIGLVQYTLVLLIAVFWFRVFIVGSYFTLLLAMFAFLLSCVGVGLSVSAVAKNMQQVMVYNFIFLVPFILLSGLVTPIRNMPVFLQYLTHINPMRFAVEAVRRVYIEGAGLSAVGTTILPMLLIAVVTMTLAAWMFRHKL